MIAIVARIRRIKQVILYYGKDLLLCLQRKKSVKMDARYELQAIQSRIAINALLETALSKLSLERQLEVALEIILTVPWLSLENKGAIFLFDKNEQKLKMRAHINMPEAQSLCSTVALGQCLCGRVAESRRLLFSGHVGTEHTNTYDGMPPHGHYCVPILENWDLIGVLNLYVPDGHVFNKDEENFLSVVAGTITNLIELRRAEQSIADEIIFSNTILETTTSYIIILDPEGRILTFNHATRINLGYELNEVVGHYLWDFFSKEDEIKIIKERIRSIEPEPRMDTYNGYWMRTKKGIDRLIEWNKSPVTTSRHGNIIICTGNDITEHSAYVNMLRYSSTHDKLTDTLNRQEMIIVLTQLSRTKRKETNIIAMVDIDHFRDINNTHGHLAGDKVLIRFASFLKTSVRRQDYIFRYGGEEFLILITNISLEDATELVTRICKNIARTPIDIGEKGAITITASFGVATLECGIEIEKSISNADKVLYEAKNSGRNRVCVFNATHAA